MCDVCVAINLIDGQTVKVKSVINKNEYGLKGTSPNGPERGPCSYSLQKNGKWTRKINTSGSAEDLATVVANGGFDISPQVRKKHHDDWIENQFKQYSRL